MAEQVFDSLITGPVYNQKTKGSQQAPADLSKMARVIDSAIFRGASYNDIVKYLTKKGYSPEDFMNGLDKQYGYDRKIQNEFVFGFRDHISALGDVFRGNKGSEEGFVDAFTRNLKERRAVQNFHEMKEGTQGLDAGTFAAAASLGIGTGVAGTKMLSRVGMRNPVAQGVTIGAGEGGLRGAAESPNLEQLLSYIALYGGTGGTFAAGSMALTSGIGKLFRYMKGLTDKGAEDRAEEVIFDIYKEYGEDAGTAARTRQEMQEKFPEADVISGDVSPASRDLLEAGAQGLGKGRVDISERLEKRQEGQLQRLMSFFDNYLGDRQNLRMALEGYVQAASSKAGPMYQKVQNEVIDDPAVLKYMQRDMWRRAYTEAQADQAIRKGNGLSFIDMPGGYKSITQEIDGKEVTREVWEDPVEYTVGMMDQVKQNLDEVLFQSKAQATFGTKAPGSGTKATMQGIKNQRYKFVEALDDIAPDYKAARNTFSGEMDIAEAIEAGSKFMRGKRDDIHIDFKSLKTDSEREAYRMAARNAIEESLGNMSPGTNMAEKLRKANMMDKFQVIFRDEADFHRAGEFFNLESQSTKTTNQLLRNSATQRRGVMDQRLGEDPTAREIIALMYQGITNPTEAAARATQLIKGASPKVRDRIARIVLEDERLISLSANVPGRKANRMRNRSRNLRYSGSIGGQAGVSLLD